MLYLIWQDATPKKSTEAKIVDACAAYATKFHRAPNVVICNEGQRVAVAGLVVRSEARIGPDLFHVGWESGVEVPTC